MTMTPVSLLNCPTRRRPQTFPASHIGYNFGSAHASACNFVFCDGSVRSISYAVDLTIYRRLGNRKDGEPIDASRL